MLAAASQIGSSFSTLELVLIAVAALAGGAANAVAGGGTFITFPVLTGVGLVPTVANITNTVAMSPGYLGGTLAQRQDLRGQRRRMRVFVVVGVAGGVIGGLLLLSTKERVFEVLVPFLILGATALLAFQDHVQSWVERLTLTDDRVRPDLEPWAVLLVFVAAIYGGYFGAGLGIVLLGVIGVAVRDSLIRVNALKQVTSFWVNISAATFFVFSGQVAWPAAAVMAVAALMGGVLGGRLVGRMRQVVLRRTVVVIGLVVSAVFFLRLL